MFRVGNSQGCAILHLVSPQITKNSIQARLHADAGAASACTERPKLQAGSAERYDVEELEPGTNGGRKRTGARHRSEPSDCEELLFPPL